MPEPKTYYSNTSAYGPRLAVALVLDVPLEQVELKHDGTGFYIVRPEDANPNSAAVAAQAPPAPDPSTPLTDVEILFNQVQGKLDADEFLRTGKAVDKRGAVSVARAWAATGMLSNGWHYPSEADLSTGSNPAILAAIYADPTSNTTEESSVEQKRKVLHFTLVMLEGQAFGLEYQGELGAYERTASKAFLAKLATDSRDWLALPVHTWASIGAMFSSVML